MALALYSLALGVAIRPGFAMTGELNLSGLVMPVGGIREKLIAAKRARVKQVVLPAANRSDFDELPDVIKRGLKIHFAETFEQVAILCLPPAAALFRSAAATTEKALPPGRKGSRATARP
jgi:ATP-dependent Lon protease